MTWLKINVEYETNTCKLICKLQKRTHNFKSCDLFIGDNEILFSSGSTLFRHVNLRNIDTKDIENIQIYFDTERNEFSFQLPCLPDESLQENTIKLESMNTPESDDNSVNTAKCWDMRNLHRIIDMCTLSIDSNTVPLEKNFDYGFGGHLHDDTALVESTLKLICKLPNPSHHSPLQRRYQRESDEADNFSKDQYKLNFIELDVPEGLANPMEFTMNLKDDKLTKKQEKILANVCSKNVNIDSEDTPLIQCGLIDILLAICYDVRSTQNDPSCESAWTRNILSPSLSYFEAVHSLHEVIQIFFRRSLIYPLYRNYDLSQICLRDAIEALRKGRKWILKQFLITYELFMSSADSRQLLNKYFIEDYIRYLNCVIEDDELATLSRNLKNFSLNINKKDLRLGLNEIEGEILHELIYDMHLGHSSDSDDLTDEEESDSDSNQESTNKSITSKPCYKESSL